MASDQQQLVQRQKGITPTGVAGALAPILVLLGSNRMPSYQIAVLQLITVFLVQILSIALKTGSLSKRITVSVVNPSPAAAPSVGRIQSESEPKQEKVQIVDISEPEQVAAVQEVKRTQQRQPQVLPSQIDVVDLEEKLPKVSASRVVAEHPLYSNSTIDACLRHFLSILDPSQLAHLPNRSESEAVIAPLPLSQWEQMLSTDNLQVVKHPTIPHLYALSAVYPDIPLRNLWELLIDIRRRPSWDTMTSMTEDLDSIGMEEQGGAISRQATITYLATKGMFPVKANDMVMLSVNARLMPTDGPVRLVCATTSVEHPSKPVVRGYSRMQLTISGFIAEELPGGEGTRVTQLTDLSALGSWVPSKIIRMVTESMIPKSLAKIGEVARDLQLRGPRVNLEGDAWLPPTIGAWDAPTPPPPASPASSVTLASEDHSQPNKSGSTKSRRRARKASSVGSTDQSNNATAVESDEEQEGGAVASDIEADARSTASVSSLDKLPASSARDMRELVVQLRSVNARLSRIERITATASSTSTDSLPGSPGSLLPPHGNSAAHGGAAKPSSSINGYHPPSNPLGVGRVTENALSREQAGGGPLVWMRAINVRSFISGLGTGVFSTTTAATVAALVVFWLRRRKIIG